MLTFAVLVAGQTAPAPTEISGTVTYRERMALTPNSELIVEMSRFLPNGGQVRLAELRMPLNGSQVPVPFRMSYRAGSMAGQKLTVIARIVREGEVLFESPSHTPVRAGSKVTLNLVRALATESWLDQVWKLVELEGKKVDFSERPPTLRFQRQGSQVSGFSGVNQFSGTFIWKAPEIQIDSGAMTMMAGSPERMLVESSLMRVLPTVNRAVLYEGQLRLMRGQKVVARLEKGN